MPTTLDDQAQPEIISSHTLSPAERLREVDRALGLCAKNLKQLPRSKPIAYLVNPTGGGHSRSGVLPGRLEVLEQPLTEQTKCFEFFRIWKLPYQDGPADDVIVKTLLLTTQTQWVMWEREAVGNHNYHSFTLLRRDQLEQCLGAEGELLLGILKGLQEASAEGEKRSTERARTYAILDHGLTEMLKHLGFIPPTSN